MNKILIIINTNTIGGHEIQAKTLINDLAKLNLILTVVCTTEAAFDFFFQNCKFEKILLEKIYVKGKIFYQILKKLEVKINLNYDEFYKIIIIGGTIEAVIRPVLFINKIRKINKKGEINNIYLYLPMYVNRTNDYGYFISKVYDLFLMYFLRIFNINKCITINKIQQRLLSKYYHLKCIIIPNQVKIQYKIKRVNKTRLVYIGRFDDKQKKILELLDFLSDKRNPIKELLLIGCGPDEALIREKADSLKSKINIAFYGWLSQVEISKILSVNDCLILNSSWEGEPMVLREAEAYGISSIARDISGTRCIIKKQYRYNNIDKLMDLLKKKYDKEFACEMYYKAITDRENYLNQFISNAD